MREIKFRVAVKSPHWDEPHDWSVSVDGYTIGEFIDGVELDFADGGTLPMNDIDWGEDEVIYSQYTGLQDKNGKEIYEGDIMTVQARTGNPHTVKVVFDGGAFLIEEYDKIFASAAYAAYPDKNGEVIGNIYENPELLN